MIMKELNKESLKLFLESRGLDVSEIDNCLSFFSEGLQYIVEYSEAPHIRLLTGVSLDGADVNENLLSYWGNEIASQTPFVKYHYVFSFLSEFIIDSFEYSLDSFAQSFDKYIGLLRNASFRTDEHYNKNVKSFETAKEECSEIPIEMIFPEAMDSIKKNLS